MIWVILLLKMPLIEPFPLIIAQRRKGLVDTAEAGVTRSVNTMTKNTALAGKVEQRCVLL